MCRGVIPTVFDCFAGIPSLSVLSFLPARRVLHMSLAGTQIALHFHVCVGVCSFAITMCAKLHHSVTIPL